MMNTDLSSEELPFESSPPSTTTQTPKTPRTRQRTWIIVGIIAVVLFIIATIARSFLTNSTYH
jgi:hypothetical protein